MPLPQITDQSELDGAINGHASTIIIFSAVWSQISEVTKDNFERVGAKYSSLYQAWINIDESPDLVEQYNITAIPVTIGYKAGAEQRRFIGPQTEAFQAENFMKSVL